jgi:hypothetical protein
MIHFIRSVHLKVDLEALLFQIGKATYREVTEYVKENYGIHVTNLNIAQVKDKCGFDKRENQNLPLR